MSERRDRSRSETLTANERIKALSGVVVNLATALLAAAVGRVYVQGGADRVGLLWILAAILLISIGLGLLHLLDGEE